MRIIAVKNEAELGKRAAAMIAAQVTVRPDCVLGLATGSTPLSSYRQLISWYEEGELDFSRVRTVNLDEYVGLDENHWQSYRWFMNNSLFDHINIDKNNTNVPNGMAADLRAEGRRYDSLIESLGGTDLQLLGIGENGHIGFNEPADCFTAATHEVVLTESTRQANARFFDSMDEVPKKAITMGMKGILSAKSVLLIALGSKKAQAVRDTVCGPVTPRVPASVLQLHSSCTIIADESALALLRSETGWTDSVMYI